MNHDNDIEAQLAAALAYLRAELGYDGESPGSLRRQVEEHAAMIHAIEGTLRGRGDELGLVGWVLVLRRSWLTMAALLGAAFGYVMNDVVDAAGVQPVSRGVLAPGELASYSSGARGGDAPARN
jgi:hypothetical protein